MTTAPGQPAQNARFPLILAILGLAAMLAGWVMLSASAPAASDPVTARDNRGSVDVADAPYAGNPRNDPKVSCSVSVLFFDFVEGTQVTGVEFERPGAGNAFLTGGGFGLGAPDPARDGLNATMPYELDLAVTGADSGKSIPVKVTVFVTDDAGRTGTKSKVFKCVAPGATTEPTEPTEPTTEPTEPTTEPTDSTEPTDAGSSDVGGLATDQASDGQDDGEVAGVDESDLPSAIDAGATGWSTVDLWGAGLAGAGGALMLVALGMSVLAVRRSA